MLQLGTVVLTATAWAAVGVSKSFTKVRCWNKTEGIVYWTLVPLVVAGEIWDSLQCLKLIFLLMEREYIFHMYLPIFLELVFFPILKSILYLLNKNWMYLLRELMKSTKWEEITKILSSKDSKCQLLGLLTLSLCFCAEPQKLSHHSPVTPCFNKLQSGTLGLELWRL